MSIGRVNLVHFSIPWGTPQVGSSSIANGLSPQGLRSLRGRQFSKWVLQVGVVCGAQPAGSAVWAHGRRSPLHFSCGFWSPSSPANDVSAVDVISSQPAVERMSGGFEDVLRLQFLEDHVRNSWYRNHTLDVIV